MKRRPRVWVVVGNAGHHSGILAPVAKQLHARGAEVRVMSCAELRGLPSPAREFAPLPTHALVPAGLRRTVEEARGRLRGWAHGRPPAPAPALPSDAAGSSSGARWARRAASMALWPRVLASFAAFRPDLVVVPNDAAFPYDLVCDAAHRAGARVLLAQEGVRFPLPTEQRTRRAYGSAADVVCAWGEASAAHFAPIARGAVVVTGNPRYDALDLDAARRDGAAVAARLGLLTGAPPPQGETAPMPRAADGIASSAARATDRRPRFGFLSNPIDDQGFVTTADKMALFDRFLTHATAPLLARGARVVVKLHPKEDQPAFRRVADKLNAAAAERFIVIADEPVLPVLSLLDAAVVLTSTVGLEAMLFDVAVGALEIPGYGFPFDYVSSGACPGIAADERSVEAGVATLFTERDDPAAAARRARYAAAHLAHRGEAATRMADVAMETVRSRRAA
jgi:hypothetical protein